MIIKDTATLREYISVNGSVDYENVKPYLTKAERNFLKPLIGAPQLSVFDAAVTDPIIKEAQALAQEAVANYGYYLGLPVLSVQITDSGIYTTENENTRSATDKQFKELQRSFKTSAHEAIDELLSYMESQPASFAPWLGSSSYTIYKELLVQDTFTFNKYFFIFNSRQTFTALKPNMIIVEDQFIVPSIGSELLTALKSTQTVANRKLVKQYVQQAVVAYTIMKTVDNGLFVIDAQGMHMRFDELPYEKTVTNINLKVNDFLVHTKKNKQTEGEGYLKKAMEIILENPLEFSEYTVAVQEAIDLGIVNSPGIVGV